MPLAHAQVRADNNSLAIGGAVTQSTINIGIPPEQLAALVRQAADLSDAQKKLIAKLEDELVLNQRQVRAALAVVGEANVAPDKLAAKLLEFAERFKELQITATARPGDDPKVASLRHQAQAAIDAGELGKADELLAEIETEQRRALERQTLNAAETLAERAKLATTRLRYRDAARHFASAAALFPPGGAQEEQRIRYLYQEATALYRQASVFGDPPTLVEAIDKLKHLMELTAARSPREAARMRATLAQTFALIGRQENVEFWRLMAIEHYRIAVEEFRVLRVPEWLQAKFEIGRALVDLGQYKRDASLLREGVMAFRTVLRNSPRERNPVRWAGVQTMLADALARLNVLEGNDSELEQAIEAYRAALEELPRARFPREWMTTQANLGNVLRVIGARRNDRATLAQSIDAYRGALEEISRDSTPVGWAQLQQSLGHTYHSLGLREQGTDRLEQALQAYRAAAEVQTRERLPGPWLGLQFDLGKVLEDLAARGDDTAWLEQAIATYSALLAAYKDDQLGHEVQAAAQARLDLALAALERRKTK